jgi:protein-disulfide isomerase
MPPTADPAPICEHPPCAVAFHAAIRVALSFRHPPAVLLTPFRILAVVTALAACTRSDASARAAAGNVAESAASAAPIALPHDSISDRADRGRIAGDSSASVWLIMASDFECPFCKQWHDESFRRIMQNYVSTGKIRLAYVNYPLSIHPNAVPASEAAMCSSVQNKFWPMHDALFATQGKWESLRDPRPVFDSLAAAIGVDTAAYRTCVTKHLTLPLIQADHDRARQAGAKSTPTFFIGGAMLEGAQPYANFQAAIDSALAHAHAGTAKPAR